MKWGLSIAGKLAVLIVVAGFLFSGENGVCEEPVYQGHPVSYWLDRFERDADGNPDILEAGATFHAMGTDALPFLIGVLTNNAAILKAFRDHPEEHRGQIAFNVYFDAGRRAEKAVTLIKNLGPAAADAIPVLLQVLKQSQGDEGLNLNDETLQTLTAMGDKTAGYLPDFIEMLKSTNWVDWRTGVTLVSAIGPKARAAVPLLEKVVNVAHLTKTVF